MEIKESIVRSLRKLRKLHRFLGLSVAIILFISALTGILLALKKDVSLLQPPTQKSEVDKKAAWIKVEDFSKIAYDGLIASYPEQKENTVDRIDLRPSKGIAKVLFDKGHWEVQVDGRSGEILSIAKRHSDWIEALHDGSIISDWFKLISMHYLGIGVILLLISGIYLWCGPRKVRYSRRRRE